MSNSQYKAHLLLVDDEEGLLFLMSDSLKREGHVVHSLDNGSRALEWLKDHEPDLIILDLKLHDLPAPALIERLRERGQEFPFIIITGHGDERTAVEVMKQGALDYVMKDAGLLELLPSIVRRTLSVIERERRLVEAGAAIRQSEQQHQKVIQTALDGFARLDMTGRFLEVNDALCVLLKYSAKELENLTVAEVDTPGHPGEFSERVRTIANQAADCFATRLRRRDGSLVEVNISIRREGTEIFAFLHDISNQRRLEREILEASEEERRRIGRDLHDGLGQMLTALEFQCHGLARKAKSEAPALVSDVEDISAHIRKAITQTRMLSHGLAPVSLDADGLTNALRDLARVTSAAAMPCELRCDQQITIPSANVATHLYRIAQEAVTNVLKHAGAKCISIRLADTGEWIELTVEDDGTGLSERKSHGGIGLQVMNYRARLVGGRIEVYSPQGKGVQVVCKLPKSI